MSIAAAEAATAAVEAPVAEAATPELLVEPANNAPAPAAKPVVSEVVRLAREKRLLERKVADLEAKQQPAPATAGVTKESLLADLKKQYEDDPEAFLESVAGEDFYKLAKRVSTKHEAPEDKIAALEKQIADLKAGHDEIAKERTAETARAADKATEAHIATVAKEIEATDADGNLKYPTLATLDVEVLDEAPALTAYNAVAHAWQKECTRLDEKTGQRVPFKKWTDKQVEERFAAAFAGLEAHYTKLRTPRQRTPGAQEPQPPELSPTISNSTSSGHADRPEKPAPGTMTVQQALRQALREHGLS